MIDFFGIFKLVDLTKKQTNYMLHRDKKKNNNNKIISKKKEKDNNNNNKQANSTKTFSMLDLNFSIIMSTDN